MDTKYKAASKMDTSDIHEVVSYAQAKGCTRAILIYPVEKHTYFPVGGTSVQSLSFPLEGELEEQGQAFLEALLTSCAGVR